MVVISWSDHRGNWRDAGFSNDAPPKISKACHRVTVVGELWHSAICIDTAREFVHNAQITALSVVQRKECLNVKIGAIGRSEKQRGQTVVNLQILEPGNLPSLPLPRQSSPGMGE